MKKLYCMYDRAVGEATPPIAARTDAEAIRAFKKAINGMQYADDQELWYVGQWIEDAPCIQADATTAKRIEVDITIVKEE